MATRRRRSFLPRGLLCAPSLRRLTAVRNHRAGRDAIPLSTPESERFLMFDVHRSDDFFDSLLVVWVVPATHETESYTLVAHGGATGTVLDDGVSVNGCSMFVRGLLIDLASPTLRRARRVPTVPKLDGIRVRSLDVSTLKCITKGPANHRDD